MNQARLLPSSAANRLANPPGSICAEVTATVPVKLLRSTHQTQITFLDEIDQGNTGIGVATGDSDDQTQIGLYQTLACPAVSRLGALGQNNLLLVREKRQAANIVQVALECIFAAVSSAIVPSPFSIEGIFFCGTKLAQFLVSWLQVI